MEPEVHYRIHKDPPLVPIRSHTNPVHSLPLYFPDIHFNIIFPSMPRSSEWFLPFRSSDQNCVRICHLSRACQSNPPLFDHNNIWWSTICEAPHCAVPPASCHIFPLRSKYFPSHLVQVRGPV